MVLVLVLILVLQDWLQGPYVYALYEDYGFDQGDIAMLFICGNVSLDIRRIFFTARTHLSRCLR